MADIEAVLYAKLIADSGLSALIGTRVYPNVIPQNATLPAIAYQRISTRQTVSHSGPSNLYRPRFQFTAVSTTYANVKAVAGALRDALNGLTDEATTPPLGVALMDNETDGFTDASDLYSVRQDYFIWFKE